MTPDERQLLSGLFDRIRDQANTPRDRDAESFIADAVRAQPYAPYLLAQTVIVQEHALRAASERLQQLEAKVQELQSASLQSASSQSAPGGGSFLGSLGKSLFGESSPPPRAPSAPPAAGPWGQTSAPPPPPVQQAYAPAPQQPTAWGGVPQSPAAGGGFLKGALGAAAGVAGGVLLADSIRGLFSGGGANPYGMASGFGGGLGGFGGGAGGETIVNNYYDSPPDQGTGDLQNSDYVPNDDQGVQDAGYDDSSDWSGADDPGGGDDTFNA